MQKQFCFICIKRQIWVWDDRRYNCLEIQNKNSRGEVKFVTGGTIFWGSTELNTSESYSSTLDHTVDTVDF